MKKILIFAFSIITGYLVSSQTVPNGGFESWITSGSYANPQYWDTPNQETTAIPIIGSAVVTKASGAYSGSWCTRLETKSFIAFTVPGFITLGQFSIDLGSMSFTMTGGAPFSLRPTALTGYYKYTPQGGDTCALAVIFYRHNPGGGTDTIGAGGFFENTGASNWTYFEIPVNWYSADNPDTVNIIAISSASLNGHAGTALYLDDLAFDFSTDISGRHDPEDLSVIYDPLTGEITLLLQQRPCQEGVLRIYSVSGQLMLHQSLAANAADRISLPASALVPGFYIVTFYDGQNNHVAKLLIPQGM